jgi:hypothetical protein
MDALQEEVHYHFFKRTEVENLRIEFPAGSLAETKAWQGIMKDKASREQAFKSGFVADMTRVLPLPDGVIQWILQELLYEKQAQLSLAYVCAIDVHLESTPGSLETLRSALLDMAGREDSTSPLETRSSINTDGHEQPNNSNLLTAVRWCSVLIGKIAKTLATMEQRSWLHILMLVLLDRGVQEDVAVKTEVQHSLAALMDAVPADKLDATIRHVGLSTIASVTNPILVYRLLSSLPSLNGAMHAFKRRLALSCFMKSGDYLSDSLDRVTITSSISALLKKSGKFKIRESTDYAVTGARIGILDIAVSAGFSDFSFLPDTDVEMADTPVMGNGRRRPPDQEEVEFNEAIDALVAELRMVMSNIRDVGAAHMQRTECKGMIEKLAYRLEYAARTRPKPKKNVFGGAGTGTGTGAGNDGLFQAFLQKKNEVQYAEETKSDDGAGTAVVNVESRTRRRTTEAHLQSKGG